MVCYSLFVSLIVFDSETHLAETISWSPRQGALQVHPTTAQNGRVVQRRNYLCVATAKVGQN